MTLEKNYYYFKNWILKKNFQKRVNRLAKKFEGKKIVLYCAGIFSAAVFDNYDLSKLDIVAVSDKKFSGAGKAFYGYKTVSPEEIPALKPDIILVSSYRPENIRKYLANSNLSDQTEIVDLIEKNIFDNLLDKFEMYLIDLYNNV